MAHPFVSGLCHLMTVDITDDKGIGFNNCYFMRNKQTNFTTLIFVSGAKCLLTKFVDFEEEQAKLK